MLSTTDRMKFDLYQHEIICADVCSAYWGKFEHWSEPSSPELASLKLEPDRTMTLYGVEYFFEIDRGSEPSRVLWDKMMKYKAYSQILRRPFHVIFVIQDYAKDFNLKHVPKVEREVARLDKQKKRMAQIEGLAIEAACGNLFLFTCQDWILKYPNDVILGSPMGQTFSFGSLSDLYK